MKPFNNWTSPVAASLLLHAALILLISLQLSAPSTSSTHLQTITVEMLGTTPATQSRPRTQQPAPPIPPTPEPIAEPSAIASPAPVEAKPAPAVTEQTLGETGATNLNVQPLSKLTRPPAFLRKIEPVYPASEQRAGSQAYVLAEITIDAQGNVLEVKIMKSAGAAFDNAVTEALKKSTFVPGYMGKEAVAVRVLVPFRFNLR